MKSDYIKTLTAVVLSLISFGILDAGEPEWKLLSTENGIDLYLRENAVNGFNEYQAIAILDFPLKSIVTVLRDFPNYPLWMPECLEAQKIEDIDENNLLLYYLHHSPWPVRNRDAILHVRSVIDPDSNIVNISSIAVPDDRYPAQSNPIRMAMMEAHWDIEVISAAKTRITYRIISDPGGSLPVSSVNLNNKNLPVRTLSGIARMLKLKRHSHPNISP